MDDREKLIYAKGSRVDGTCEWIKSNALYETWLRSRSQLLWLSGGPGKGKTMLSIFLAEEFERIVKNSNDVLFLQYFCDNKDEKRNTAVAILRGLIFQILQLCPKLIRHILPRYKIQRESLFSDSSFQTLWGVFRTTSQDSALGTTYCILDGLDECSDDSVEALLQNLRALFQPQPNNSSICYLKMILVSRELPDYIPEILSRFPRIRLDPDADSEVNRDIGRFIKARVDELATYRQYPPRLRAHVNGVFLERTKGSFLWVGIVAAELMGCRVTEVEKVLDLFPSGLEELYSTSTSITTTLSSLYYAGLLWLFAL